jgi:glycosyltransferase involved in cell wall biosynthesis
LPVVVSRVGGALEVVQDRVNGRLVPVGDPQALATAVLELYRQPDQRRRLGERARRSVSKDYSQEAMLRKLASLYLELWARGRGR